jgi:hypothetical protein
MLKGGAVIKSVSTLAALTAAALLSACALAEAAGKHRVLVDRFVDQYADSVDCADFGPYAFSNDFAGTEHVQIYDVLDASGTRLQTVFDFVLQETESNSLTGATLPLKAAEHEVWDYASNTRTLSGKVWLGTQPGSGTYVQDTGRITMTLDTRIASFVAGPHEAFLAGGVDAAVCQALASA